MSIGQDTPRVDGLSKLSGRAAYIDDIALPGAWHGGTVRSPIARGVIRNVHFDPAVDWSEFAIVDHRDIPAGRNQVRLIELDQPALAEREVRHKHEAILLLAHRSAHRLREGLRAIRIDVDPLPAVLDPSAPLRPGLIQYGADNVFKRIDIRKGAAAIANDAHAAPGDFERVFRTALLVVEGTYATGAQEHVYLETQGMAVNPENGKLVVLGSMQCPYYVLDALTHLFDRPREAFRVVQTPVGGGFGGKEDYPSLLAIHAALLAEKSGRPVKMIYDRQEDMAATTKRHPSVVRHRTAVDRDGRLLAMQIDVLLDGGAYVTLSPVVLSRGCIHAAGPYACEHVHIHGEARLTNCPPYGAFRGFGAPQTQFAMERHMDEIARRLALDPADVRRRNLLRPGQTTATGQLMRDTTDLRGLLDRALNEASYVKLKSAHAEFNRTHPYLRRGVGMATFLHGSGFTGSGEVYLASEVWIDGLADGTVELLTAQTDMGQGTTTILTQIAAERLGLPADAVRVAQPDTTRVPNSGPTVASRTAMVVGRLVERACDDLLCRVGRAHQPPKVGTAHPENSQTTGTAQPTCDAIRTWHAANPGQRLRGYAKYEKPAEVNWDDHDYRGDAYAAYSWGAYVAQVEVDLRTYQTRVTDFVAGQEVGRVLNPTLATGQVQGGVAQSIGWALYEDVVLEDGAMKNAQMTNYAIPAASDLPPIRVFFEENRSPHGPGGAKGIGEMPVDGPAPAVINAVCDALGVSLSEIPLMPERLMDTLPRE
ncbi:putative xanthine dehydrogenase subunit D [Phycisphaerae bacterium RAS1]|nr:putative xanthine dehydrogenase subunit D [Phycisphaerae bacterium RAS1]